MAHSRSTVVDGVTALGFGGGEATSPSPVDRGRKGTKRILMVDRRGVLLPVRTARAIASDHRQIIPLVLGISQDRRQAGPAR
ncbi:hypothetical protein [Paludisphaera sp.]|uniref:hypothetical protein n=1 Tax=Paludisphaera sp. TaxID=2017432 RepID=UPI00301D82A4